MANIENISCAIIVKNAAATLSNTLDSLSCFNEVIIYDNGSTDGSIEIAQNYNNVTLVQGEFLGFGETKNKAASFANNAWILSLDADETLSPTFIKSLSSLVLNDSSAYQIVRTNFYRGREIKYCWRKEHIVRLYNKDVTGFNLNKVHEFILTDGLNTPVIDGLINHYPYLNVSDFVNKAERYSTLFAQEKVSLKHSSPLKAILNAWFSFIKTYLLRGGFLDGYPGLLIAFAHMSTNFFKYMKLYEANVEQANRNSD